MNDIASEPAPPGSSSDREQREAECPKRVANYQAALRFAKAGFSVVPLVANEIGHGGRRYVSWKLAVPTAMPGSTDPKQLEAWFVTSADWGSKDWEIGIALPDRVGVLRVSEPGGLKAVEEHYSPLPETLTFADPQSPADGLYLFRSPGKAYEVSSHARLGVRDFVHVPPNAGPLVIAPCPAWFEDAHCGKDLICELDLPENVAKAKALLQEAEPETDQQEKSDRWLEKFKEKEGWEWEPTFDTTCFLAHDVLCEGVSVDRAFRLLDHYWNGRNKPPLQRAHLRELIDNAYYEEI